MIKEFMSVVIDYVVNSNRQSVQFLIFSKKHEEIAAPMINCGFIVVSVRYKKSGNEEGDRFLVQSA